MTASRLRYILIALVIIMAVGFGAGAWWLQKMLAERVTETDHAKIDAEVAQLEIEKLRQLKQRLTEQKDTVERTRLIAASADQYQYQNQIITDITTYASRHNIGISSFNFTESETKKPAAGGQSAPQATTKTPFSVTLRGPIDFNKFMQFLRDIESNLTKIQVNSLTLSPDAKNPGAITNPTLSLEVYIKK